VALGISVFHLGRPLHAVRAIKMWRRSWLSREVLFFTLFAGSAITYSILGWQAIIPVSSIIRFVLGIFVAASGLIGVFCSAMIYKVPARPSWNSWRTPVAFFATAFILGPLLALVVLLWNMRVSATVLLGAEAILSPIGTLFSAVLLTAGFVQLSGIIIKLFNTFSREEPELQASARLLTQRFKRLFLSRLGFLLAALLFVPWILFALPVDGSANLSRMAFLLTGLLLLALCSEFFGRYLFFVTVVPRKRPEGYT
jgi:DMSO reductase anchor subunit